MVIPAVSPAQERPRHVFLAEGEVHEGWYFATGDRIIIRGTVNGDAYIAGRSVEVDGTINGDLLVAGGHVVVQGTVSDDVRAAGGTVRIDGRVGKNVSVAGGDVELGSPGLVEGNLLVAAGDISLSGTVVKNVKLAAGGISMTGTVGQDAELAAGNVVVVNGARIGNNLHVKVPEKEDAQVAEGTVGGKLTIQVREVEAEQPRQEIFGMGLVKFGFKVYWILCLVAAGLALAFMFPDQFYAVGRFIWAQPVHSLLWGVAGLLAIPVAALVLLLTVFGVPLGLFVLAVYLWMLFLTQLSLGVVLGNLLFPAADKGGWTLFGAFAAGLVLVQALTFIPVVGTLVILLGLILGMGAFVLVLKTEYARVRTL